MDSKKFKTWIGVLVALSIACIVYLYFQISEAGDMWPAENEPGTLTHAIDGLAKDIARLNAEVAKIPDAQKQLEAIKIDYDMAAQVLPRESSPDQLIAAISTKAQQSGVFPSSLQPSVVAQSARGGGRGAGTGNFETWRFSLAIDGTYDQIATFVNRMEEFDSADAVRMASEKRFFEVREIGITAAGSGLANLEPESVGEPVKHKCTLLMQTYRYTGE